VYLSKVVVTFAGRTESTTEQTTACPRNLFGLTLVFMSDLVISTSPEVMGGTPVFAGTRVPIQTLFEYLEAGDTIDDFLVGFPTVTREQVLVLLETASARVAKAAAVSEEG
jgi:uncharacterized protein (DUF433 family)